MHWVLGTEACIDFVGRTWGQVVQLCVRIYSSHLLFIDALSLLVEKMGFKAVTGDAARAEVALYDLTTVTPPYPPPPPLPTVAHIVGGEFEAVELLGRRYRGYVTAEDDIETLKRALEAVRRGDIWADREVLTRVISKLEEPQLTPKEQEVLYLLVKGLPNRTIGEHLHITEGTVKMHVSHLFSKLCVKSRFELIAKQIGR